MTGKELKELINGIPDNAAIVVTRGNAYKDFKIVGVEDSTSIGVYEIRYTDFETDNYWEE
jgi:predicted secreted protein